MATKPTRSDTPTTSDGDPRHPPKGPHGGHEEGEEPADEPIIVELRVIVPVPKPS